MSTFYDPGLWGDYAIWVKAANDYDVSNPYEAKCLYVLGTIRHLTYAANKLYPKLEEDGDHRLPAYVLSFNILELLGRCLNGDTEHRGNFDKRIKSGLRYIARLETDKTKKVRTRIASYDIPSDALIGIRNFAAHGFYGSPDSNLVIDGLLLAWLLGEISEATQRYYDELRVGKNCREMLQATINPLYNSDTGKLTRIGPIQEDIKDKLSLSKPREGTHEGTWNWSADYDQVKLLNR